MKKCGKCKKIKEITDFYKRNASKDGLTYLCRICSNIHSKEWQKKHPDYIKKHNDKHNKIASEKRLRFPKYYSKIIKYFKYIEKKLIKKQEKFLKKKNQKIQQRLAHNLRSRLQCALKRNQKIGSAVRDLGCSIDDLKKHLESKFKPGMTWNNYGLGRDKWAIDHIIPLSKVDLTNREEFLKVNNYKNLQPLWFSENMKKFNKIF